MKNVNGIITLLAVLILLGILGYLVFNKNGQNEPSPAHIITIDGEEIAIDYPLVNSFSNAESNNTATTSTFGTNGGSQGLGTVASHIGAVAQNIVTRPFILGLYYLNNIAQKGIENCHGNYLDEEEKVSIPSSEERDYTLTRVEMYNDQAYLFVDGAQVPKDICAYMMQFHNMPTNLFQALHIIFQ